MNFTLDRKKLLEILTPTQAVIPTRSTLPTLQNVKLSVNSGNPGSLTVEGTDLDVSLSRTVEAEVATEGEILVSAKRLYEVVRELPDLKVSMEQKGMTLHLACGRSIFKLPGIGTDDYPKIPTVAGSTEDSSTSGQGFKLKVPSLLRAVDKVSFAISTDESRPPLCGLLWQVSEEEMKLVATDGHRLALMTTGCLGDDGAGEGRGSPEGVAKSSPVDAPPERPAEDSAGSSGQIIVPQKALRLLDLLLRPYGDRSELEVDVRFEESSIGFFFSLPQSGSDAEGKDVSPRESSYLSSRLISGLYPDYNSVLPKDNNRLVRVSREELTHAIRRVTIFSDPYTHLVKFSIAAERIALSATSPQGGEAHDEVECDYGGEVLEMGYNAHYVLDVLKRIEADEVEIQLKTAVDAGIFVPAEQREKEKVVYLLMPIRLLGQ
jgi:DNA polymerase-3 subunit beta